MDNERKIKIKDEYLKLIIDIGFDYDRLEKAESLKDLIDDLVKFAKLALFNDDKSIIFEGVNDKKFNILAEQTEGTLKDKLSKALKDFEHVKADPDNAVAFYKTIKKIVEGE